MAFTAEEEAALRGIIAIYKTQAPSLSDDVAEIAPALYDQWTGDGHYYTAGERVEHGGTLYVCLQPHTSQADWTPAAAPSLWARNLAAADSPDATDVPAWEQPDATNGYPTGAVVTHGGSKWQSLVDNNVWEPGVAGTETLWQVVDE